MWRRGVADWRVVVQFWCEGAEGALAGLIEPTEGVNRSPRPPGASGQSCSSSSNPPRPLDRLGHSPLTAEADKQSVGLAPPTNTQDPVDRSLPTCVTTKLHCCLVPCSIANTNNSTQINLDKLQLSRHAFAIKQLSRCQSLVVIPTTVPRPSRRGRRHQPPHTPE